jgi:hypothetical protein
VAFIAILALVSALIALAVVYNSQKKPETRVFVMIHIASPDVETLRNAISVGAVKFREAATTQWMSPLHTTNADFVVSAEKGAVVEVTLNETLSDELVGWFGCSKVVSSVCLANTEETTRVVAILRRRPPQ